MFIQPLKLAHEPHHCCPSIKVIRNVSFKDVIAHWIAKVCQDNNVMVKSLRHVKAKIKCTPLLLYQLHFFFTHPPFSNVLQFYQKHPQAV